MRVKHNANNELIASLGTSHGTLNVTSMRVKHNANVELIASLGISRDTLS